MTQTAPQADSHAHAGLMDRIYGWQKHIYDLTRKPYLLGRDPMIARLDAAPDHHVLEIGCGTGRNLIAAAKRYPEARFYGVDISSVMLEVAEESVRRAGLADRIVLAQGDARDFDAVALFGRERFERVYFSYALSMIPEWPRALAHGYGLCAPGGRVLTVDFGAQEKLPAWFRWILVRWLAVFHVAPCTELFDRVRGVKPDAAPEPDCLSLYGGYAWLTDQAL